MIVAACLSSLIFSSCINVTKWFDCDPNKKTFPWSRQEIPKITGNLSFPSSCSSLWFHSIVQDECEQFLLRSYCDLKVPDRQSQSLRLCRDTKFHIVAVFEFHLPCLKSGIGGWLGILLIWEGAKAAPDYTKKTVRIQVALLKQLPEMYCRGLHNCVTETDCNTSLGDDIMSNIV